MNNNQKEEMVQMIGLYHFSHLTKQDYKPIYISYNEWEEIKNKLTHSNHIIFNEYGMERTPDGYLKYLKDPIALWQYTYAPHWTGLICDEVYIVTNKLKNLNRGLDVLFKIIEKRLEKRLK